MMSNHATARAAGNRGAAMTHGDGFGLKRARVNDRIIGRQRNSISGYGRRTNKHWRNQDSRKKTIFHSRARPDEKTWPKAHYKNRLPGMGYAKTNKGENNVGRQS
jgi:hypothetical protein